MNIHYKMSSDWASWDFGKFDIAKSVDCLQQMLADEIAKAFKNADVTVSEWDSETRIIITDEPAGTDVEAITEEIDGIFSDLLESDSWYMPVTLDSCTVIVLRDGSHGYELPNVQVQKGGAAEAGRIFRAALPGSTGKIKLSLHYSDGTERYVVYRVTAKTVRKTFETID